MQADAVKLIRASLPSPIIADFEAFLVLSWASEPLLYGFIFVFILE